MNCRELYREARKTLADAGADPADALALSERFLGLDRAGLVLHGEKSPPPEAEELFRKAVGERAARRPLQYILGSWDFMGLSLKVGEGVLCPRDDTGILVETAAEALAGRPCPQGLDLCAGTGAVALGLCSLVPEAFVACLELSGQAFPYLEQNLAAYPEFHVSALRADVLLEETAAGFPADSLDFIVSNPPYVRSGELSSLQPEVRREPAAALDGGGDGLLFYRAIGALWLPRLKPGGLLAVEIGEDQASNVREIFRSHGLEKLETRRDWAGLDRVVMGIKR